LQCVAVCCSVWQCVAVCCSVWQCVAECLPAEQRGTLGVAPQFRLVKKCQKSDLAWFDMDTAKHCNTLQHTATHCNTISEKRECSKHSRENVCLFRISEKRECCKYEWESFRISEKQTLLLESSLQSKTSKFISWHQMRCSVLQCVAVCCSVLQCVAVCCSVLPCVAVCCSVLQCVALCCGVLQCVAVYFTTSNAVEQTIQDFYAVNSPRAATHTHTQEILKSQIAIHFTAANVEEQTFQKLHQHKWWAAVNTPWIHRHTHTDSHTRTHTHTHTHKHVCVCICILIWYICIWYIYVYVFRYVHR